MRSISLFFTSLILIIIAGCKTLPVEGNLPNGLTARPITTVESGSAFAISPDGSVAALFSSGLKLFHIPTQESYKIGDKKPDALAWSPMGYSLAALYHTPGKSSIVVHDQLGLPMAEQTLNDDITGICWLSEQEIAASGLKVKDYKFGSNYKSILYRWKPGRDLPVMTELRDSTLRPPTFLKWRALLERGPLLSTGISTGQIAYLHPVDPPLFTPYYKIIIRDLDTGLEIEAANAALTSTGAKFSADGEKLIYGDGNGSMFLLNPWSEEKLKTASSPGESLAMSPDGASWFADGAVFNGDSPAVLLAPGGEATFSTDSSRLFISSGSKLYLITGIKPLDGALFVPEVAEKVSKLRSMRTQGLITPSEYKASMERILKP
jgi:hypothetical protein